MIVFNRADIVAATMSVAGHDGMVGRRSGASGSIRALVTAFVLVTVAVAGALPSYADDVTEAEALIRQGVALRMEGKDEHALPLFQKAYGLTRTPRTAGQLGLAEMSLGYWPEAEAHLSEAVESPGHPWVAKNRATLDKALAALRGKIGEVTVTGKPAGAEVRMNHRLIGKLPLPAPARVGEGRVDVEIVAPGYRPFTKTISVAGGNKKDLTAVLEPESVADGAATAMAKPSPPPSVLEPVRPLPSAEAAPAATGRDSSVPGSVPAAVIEAPSSGGEAPPSGADGGHRTLAYVGMGVAFATLVFAGIETIRWQGKQSDFDNHRGPGPGGDPTMPALFYRDCGAAEPMRGGAGCQDLYSSAQQARTLAVIGAIAGVALGGGALALFFWGGGEGAPSGSHAQQAACFPDPLARGAGCRWSF